MPQYHYSNVSKKSAQQALSSSASDKGDRTTYACIFDVTQAFYKTLKG